MKAELTSFGYSEDIVNIVKPIVDVFDENDLTSFKKEYSSFTIDMCDKIDSKELEPIVADKYYTLIDLYISDNFPNVKLGETIEKIMHEGMILHDLGKEYGSDLSVMKSLANELKSE